MTKERLRCLGQSVRRHRHRQGLTQEQLGAPHVSKSFVSQMEKGAVSPSLLTLFHIGDRLGVPPHQLLLESDPVPQAAALLDMAEAALFHEGIGAGNEWIAHLDNVLPVESLPTYRLQNRWRRYTALLRLQEKKLDAAVRLLESSDPDDDPVAAYWLGFAHRRKDELLQALRTWEGIVHPMRRPRPKGESGESDTVLSVATWSQLAALYEALGDSEEAARARGMLQRCMGDDAPPPEESATSSQPWGKTGGLFPHRHPSLFSILLWQEAQRAWSGANYAGAAALARLVPLFASLV